MAHVVRERGPVSQIGSILNSDGKSHPTANAFMAVTVLLGLIAFVTAFFPGLHLIASWAGLLGIGAGMWGLMISATTAGRFLLFLGLGASGVGFYLGVAHGGLWGGVLG